MNQLLLGLSFLLVLPLSLLAQTRITSIDRVADGLYMMYYDSTAEKRSITKSAVVEFQDCIALLEMPISNGGAGATSLTDHVEGGEKVLEALKSRFPGKPLKYVLTSHWHPHSISSILPFISRGITLVTTRKNFARLREMVDSATVEKYGGNIRFVDGDSMTIGDRFNTIVAYRFDKSDYPNVPTQDFLYFYLPKYNYLHSSCMFQRFQGYRVKGKELVSGRVEDLNRFIIARKIAPRGFITTDTYWDEGNGIASNDSMQKALRGGITMGALESEILDVSEESLVRQSDSIVKELMADGVPVSILNSAVYAALGKHDLKKALALARLQALANPSDPNAWDTYGEVYYFMGETELAAKYERQRTRIDPHFTGGGVEVWKKDLEEYRRRWEAPSTLRPAR